MMIFFTVFMHTFNPSIQFLLKLCLCVCLFATTCVFVGFMSRVQAIRDHHGKDCRFLSFRRGDTFFVYHKLTGKREDLWAGSVSLISPSICLYIRLILSLKQHIINQLPNVNNPSSQVLG